ncbi:hypothetical protein G6550_17795, partial [Azonexus fungiphilus]|nr:hypothetical protein [Azonexus fungiphilus]
MGDWGNPEILGRKAMRTFAIKSGVLLLAAGLGLGAAGSAFSAESLQDVLKRRGLSQQDL